MDLEVVDDELIAKVLSNNLIRARNKAGLSYREAEKITGINKSTICSIEKCKREPRVTTYIKLMYAYNQIYNKKEKSKLVCQI